MKFLYYDPDQKDWTIISPEECDFKPIKKYIITNSFYDDYIVRKTTCEEWISYATLWKH
jgi:hypothetical protein